MIEYAGREYTDEEIYSILSPEIKRWFKNKFGSFTPPQRFAVMEIHNGNNILISSPTGSGKTFAAFLASINELLLLAKKGKLEDKIYVLYVSPLKALNNDIERNLKEPLREIYRENEIEEEIRIAVRTGDTSPNERQKQAKKTPHILITTPESFAIILNAPKFSKKLKEVKWIIVDEIHAMADNKRGVHLSLSLERLTYNMEKEPIRIGLSATIHPMKEIAKFLVGGERKCRIVDVNFIKKIDLKVISPVDDLIYTPADELSNELYKLLYTLIKNHRTTLIFTNTRSATERVVFHLKSRFKELEGKIEAHHGSLSRDVRLEVEKRLKSGDLKCVVSSTSLELGIDIGYIDLVVLLSSPKSVTRALQRIGRSGHFLHEISKGRIVVLDRDDLVECVVLAKEAKDGRLDRVKIPRNALDVLAQHIVGMAIEKKWRVNEALNLIRKAYPYKNLSRRDFVKLLHYLAGEYEELEDRRVYGKIWFDEDEKIFGRRGKMVRPIYYLNTGTIPDEVAVKVYTTSKKYVGKVEEPFAERLKKGDIFVLAGNTYEYVNSKGMRIYVVPRPESSPTIPSWFSEQLPLSFDLAQEISKFRDKMEKMILKNEDIVDYLVKNYYINETTANAVKNYFMEQKHFIIPNHRRICVEVFEENGYRHIVFHTLVGRKSNEALSRIFAYRITKKHGFNVRIAITDNGFAVIYSRNKKKLNEKDIISLFSSKNIKEDLKNTLKNTEILKRRFRHVAVRSLLILKNYLGHEMSVERQQRNASTLFKVVNEIDTNFPALKETYREIMEDSMDIENTKNFIRKVEEKKIEVKVSYQKFPSPFSLNIVAVGASDVVLMEDRKKMIREMHKEIMEMIECMK
ncbi:MAG TPA: ATP-dependent helicase [Thermoplasmatales archaeon]|nr:ATP-dependent helicase [Thermoplasmatales archaeon]